MPTPAFAATASMVVRAQPRDLSSWRAAREELLVCEKAHTREGDAIAATRRRLPMVELDGAVEVTGVDGPVPLVDLFQGRDELVVYKHMWSGRDSSRPDPLRRLCLGVVLSERR